MYINIDRWDSRRHADQRVWRQYSSTQVTLSLMPLTATPATATAAATSGVGALTWFNALWHMRSTRETVQLQLTF